MIELLYIPTMHIEGIIIHKTPYKERDLICNLLLRSGKTLSVYFYGGRGGGKKGKGSILEVGFMLSIELNPRRKKIETEIQIAKEYKLLWNPGAIREDFRAFYLSTFYMEYLSKIAIEDDLDEATREEHAGLFNVLSNGLFYLDDAVKRKVFNLHTHLFIFLTKLSIHLGIAADLEHCLFCEKILKDSEMCLFDPQNGGFSCLECGSKKDEFLSENKNLREEYQSSVVLKNLLKKVYLMSYKEFESLGEINQGLTVAEFNYINYQFGFNKDQFNSWKMISV